MLQGRVLVKSFPLALSIDVTAKLLKLLKESTLFVLVERAFNSFLSNSLALLLLLDRHLALASEIFNQLLYLRIFFLSY